MDDLIDLIYETVADPTIWSAVARRMSEQLDAQSFWMFYMHPTGPDFLALQGLSPSLLQAYEAHFHSRDILMEEELRRPLDFLGRAVREQEIVGERVWQASEIYNDLARPNGMHHVLSMNLSSAETQAVPFLTFFRPPGTAMFEDGAVSCCEDIIPHLQRAIRLNRLICLRRRTIPEWTATLLDQIPAGIFLLDGRGAVLHANRSAQAILARRDGLAIKGGRLVTTGAQPDAGLERAIAACVSAQRRGGEIRLERAEGHWLVSICPLTEAAAAGVTGEGHCRGWVWLSDATPAPGDMARRLEALFGLTAAEQRVAAALARRCSPAEIAQEHGVTLNTVRTQVKSIFGTLGVGRQVEVTHLLAEISALPTGR
jgi:DNA-binding CsgD family transcriptional regulator/PAS domain-containing protein